MSEPPVGVARPASSPADYGPSALSESCSRRKTLAFALPNSHPLFGKTAFDRYLSSLPWRRCDPLRATALFLGEDAIEAVQQVSSACSCFILVVQKVPSGVYLGEPPSLDPDAYPIDRQLGRRLLLESEETRSSLMMLTQSGP